MTYLDLLILIKRSDCHMLASISKDTCDTELVAMTWLDCNWQDFVGTVYGISDEIGIEGRTSGVEGGGEQSARGGDGNNGGGW
jgi:hypothetical protein